MVGLATETKEQHMKRHPKSLRTCPRCVFYLLGARWQCAYGRVPEVLRTGRNETVGWLAERPARWGGAWGLGCVMCAEAAARVATGDVEEGAHRRRGSTWARFEVRCVSLQAEHVRQHREYDVHKLAVLAWLRPDAPVRLQMQATLSDDALLAGATPQPEDWLRAWRAARTPQSWRAAAESLHTEHFIRQTRERSVGSRPLEQMARVIREAVRIQKRLMLRASSAISLLFDDRAGYKLVRFRCTVPTASTTDPVASQGGESPPSGSSLNTTDPVASQGGESPPSGSSRKWQWRVS